MTDLLNVEDFEVLHEDNTVQVLEGHPGYCPLTTDHEPHVHEYRALRGGQPVRGWFHCKGDPAPWVEAEPLP